MPIAKMILRILLFALIPGITLAESLPCPCHVVEVVDGDTVFVQDQSRTSRKIWLAGIDAPELGQPQGKESRNHLIKLVLGQAVDVEYAKRDRYGRIIGKLIKNDQDINLRQIKNGLAWYFITRQGELSQQDHKIYQATQQHAKLQRDGLWSSDSPVPPWKFRINR